MSCENRKTAVVIVAHREYATLGECLRGFSLIVNDPTDLIFVDNGSGGSLSRFALERTPGATVITLNENRYFCGGYNAGITWAMDRNYEFVLIVNADTEVINCQFIETLLDAMERSPRVAFMGPEVYYRRRDQVQTTC
jgi:GT2 family glycosyltransferase